MCPDFDKATPELTSGITQYLASLDDTMMRRVAGLEEGILTKTKYLPTIAEIHALVQELKANDERFKATRAQGYKYFKAADPVDIPPVDRRRELAAEAREIFHKADDNLPTEVNMADIQRRFPGGPSKRLIESVRKDEGWHDTDTKM